MIAGIGHNSGQVHAPGHSWRKHVWTKARKDLMPTLPIEVVRMRVRRAQELGLPYKTYAGIRASTGHDLIGFMFSSNALRVMRDQQDMPADRADKLAQLVATHRVGLAHKPVTAARLVAHPGIDSAHRAPRFVESWSETRDRFAVLARNERTPADRMVLVGDTAFERDWCAAGHLAGYLSADDYFANVAG